MPTFDDTGFHTAAFDATSTFTGSASPGGAGSLTAAGVSNTAAPGGTLTDTFAAEDATKWTGYGPTVRVTGGRLEIDATYDYPALESVGTFDLADSAVTFQLVQPPNYFGGVTEAYLATNGGRGPTAGVSGGLYFFNHAADYTPEPYDPAHGWFRIRAETVTPADEFHTDALVSYETSADGVVWEVRATVNNWWNAADLVDLPVMFQAGNYGDPAADQSLAGTAAFDNLNVPPAAPSVTEWVRRSVVAAPRNGTLSHTVTFTPATAGNLLVAVFEGAVTSTTPSGWTLPAGGSAVNNSGLYVWFKTATAGESTFTTMHNASNYPAAAVVYEFPAGSTFVGSAATINNTTPSLTGLTGTNLLMGAGAVALHDTSSPVWSWTAPAGVVKDVDQTVPFAATDGYSASVAYVTGSTATTWAPTSSVAPVPQSQERLSFAVKVAGSVSAFTGSAALSGSGVLSTARTVAVAAAVALAGAGSLTATGVPAPSVQVALSGAGSVTASASPGATRAVALSGSGALSAAPTVGISQGAGFGSSGSLSSTGSPSTAGSVAFIGVGTFTATGSPIAAGSVTFTGPGALSGTGSASQAGATIVLFTGTGTLTAAARPAIVGAVTFTGAGNLATDGAPATVAAVTLVSGGDMRASGIPAAAATAPLAGAGTLTATGYAPGAWRNITITVGAPTGYQLTIGHPAGSIFTTSDPVGNPAAVGSATTHPLHVDPATGRTFTVGPPEA